MRRKHHFSLVTSILITSLLGLLSCSNDFNDWTGVPQQNAANAPASEEEVSVKATQATESIDFSTLQPTDMVKLFNVQTAGEMDSYLVEMMNSDGGRADVTSNKDGEVLVSDIKQAVRTLGIKAGDDRKVSMDMVAVGKVKTADGEFATRYKSDAYDLSIKLAYDQATGDQGTAIYCSDDNGVSYDVRPMTDGTVAIYKMYYNDNLSTDLFFPHSVKVYDEEGNVDAEYEVSQVGLFNEFKLDKDDENIFSTFATSITIAEGIKTIGRGAFTNWNQNTTLTKVTMPSTLAAIEAGAFNGCDGLTEIICNAPEAPTLVFDNGYGDHFHGKSSWDYIGKNCKVYVPTQQAVETYHQTDPWTDWCIFYDNGNVVVKEN